MDPYDSDSSIDDAGDYTETGVLLGYASEEATDDTISHLGGWPTWLDESTPPDGNFANCKVCNNPMLLLLQLNGDLPEHFPDDERRLYIFGCPRKACSRKPGSVRALRGVRKLKSSQKPKKEEKEEKQSTPQPPAPKQDLGAALFGAAPSSNGPSSNPNPFSTSTSSSSSSAQANNPFAPLPKPSSSSPAKDKDLPETFADKVRLSSPPPESAPAPAPAPVIAGPPRPWPPQSAFPKPYTQYYLDAEYETLSRPSTPSVPANVTVQDIEEEDIKSAAAAAGAADSKDAFESALDKDFLRFSTRLSHNPEQVLRYEFRGSPLLYSQKDAVGKLFQRPQGPSGKVSTTGGSTARIPRCESCGRERVFELQLVPHAISVLEEGREGIGLGPKDDSGMEWGTIILGVCAGDCGPEQVGVMGWREEWVGVQWEERK